MANQISRRSIRSVKDNFAGPTQRPTTADPVGILQVGENQTANPDPVGANGKQLD